MSDAETAHAYRGMISRSVVRSTNDTGGSQQASITVHRHVDRTDVEVAQAFGFASRAPAGGLMIVLAVGGDQGDLVGIPIGNEAHRLGNLAEGESAQYNLKGDRIHIKADGTIDIVTRNKVTVRVKTVAVEVTEDRVVSRIGTGSGASRHVVRPAYAKMRTGANYVLVNAAGVWCSVPPVVGPDPEPSV